MIVKFAKNYAARHQNRMNQLLHLFGLPITFVVPVVLLVEDKPWWALGSFILGYALQFLGHAIEGNDAGEMVLIKKILGKPYVEFAPSAKESKSDD